MYVGECVYLIYKDESKAELTGFVHPGAEFRATTVDGTEVGRADSIDEAASHLES